MKKTLKKVLPFLLLSIAFLSLIGGLLNFYLTGQPEAVSVEQLNNVLTNHNLNPLDITDNAQGNFPGGGLSDCIVAEQDDIRFEFYNFDNPNNALKIYREARKLIVTTKMATPRTQIETEKANYKFYSLEADGNYSVTIYVKNTAIYAYCNAENLSTIITILDDIDYVKTKEKQEVPGWVSAIVRVFQYALLIPAALFSRSFYWKAAYKSADVTISEINKQEKTRRELLEWLLEISTKQKTTKAILAIYKYFLIPEYISIVLAVVGCFTTSLDSLLNKTLGFIVIGIIFMFGFIGVALNKKYNTT